MRVLRLALLVLLGGCTSSGPVDRVLSVYAAASLTDVMAQAEPAFEAAHDGVDVQVTLAGTQVLRLQIEQGAPADVLLPADPVHLEALVEQGLAEPRGQLAVNEVVLLVPAASPVVDFADLPRVQRLVVGAPTVPIGRYTEQILERAQAVYGPEFAASVRAHIVSRESNVRLVRSKVALGEADGALVYRTDARGVDGVRIVELPDAVAVRATYPMARVLRDPTVDALADAFLAHLASPEAREVLSAHGFGAP